MPCNSGYNFLTYFNDNIKSFVVCAMKCERKTEINHYFI